MLWYSLWQKTRRYEPWCYDLLCLAYSVLVQILRSAKLWPRRKCLAL